jgi:hypothetical protein
MNKLHASTHAVLSPGLDDDLPSAPATQEPPPCAPEPWRLEGVNLVLVPSPGPVKGPAEVTLRLSLHGEMAAPFVTAAVEQELALRRHVSDLIGKCPEHDIYVATAGNLAELEAEHVRLTQAVAGIEQELTELVANGEGVSGLAALSQRETEAKAKLALVDRALSHARRERDAKASDLHRAALALARQESLRVLTEIDAEEKTACGMLTVAAGELNKLITLGSLAGAIRNPHWPAVVGTKAAEAVVGTFPATVRPFQTDVPSRPPLGSGGPLIEPPVILE